MIGPRDTQLRPGHSTGPLKDPLKAPLPVLVMQRSQCTKWF